MPLCVYAIIYIVIYYHYHYYYCYLYVKKSNEVYIIVSINKLISYCRVSVGDDSMRFALNNAVNVHKFGRNPGLMSKSTIKKKKKC